MITRHAKMRALERYGLHLTDDDGAEILAACRDGRAQRMQVSPLGTTFLWTYRDVLVLPVLRGNILVTFQPQNYFTPEGKNERMDAKRGKGDRHPSSRPRGKEGVRTERRANRRYWLDDQ